MAKYAVVRTDKMFGTQVKSGLQSFRYFETENQELVQKEIENGRVVKIDGLLSETVDNVTTVINREQYKAVAPAADTDKKDILLVCTPEVVFTKAHNALDEFINRKDMPARGYHLHENDIFSVTDEALDGTPALGSVVELQAGTKLKVVSSATNGSTVIGKIIQIEQVGSYKFNVIQVA